MLDYCLVHELGIEATCVLIRHVYEVVEFVLFVLVVCLIYLVATVEVGHFGGGFAAPEVGKLLKGGKIQCFASIPDIEILILFRK